jgi:hypothetical protein
MLTMKGADDKGGSSPSFASLRGSAAALPSEVVIAAAEANLRFEPIADIRDQANGQINSDRSDWM